MRPRGESSSSPVSRNVGQVAVQKPQCTQARNIFSDRAMSGSARAASEKCVCIALELRAQAAALQNMRGVETFLDAPRQRRQRRRLRLEHIDRRANLGARANERRVAAEARHYIPQHRGVSIWRGFKTQPN